VSGIETLDWDSEFFGLRIGRVCLDGATPKSLADIDEEARDRGFECLYGTLDASEAVEATTAYVAQQFGHRLVEVSQLFTRKAAPYVPPKPTTATVRRGTLADVEHLEGAFEVLAPWSRFGADPRFGLDAAERMHRAWVERAARDTDQRLLAIAEDESGIIGVSTNVWGAVPRVDFMGVTAPGSGAAQALMGALMDWADEGETQAGPCAARNIAVLRYVEGCGFRVSRVQYLFHRWLDEDAGEVP
jgi:dTDP-4-amino-4,6-dideoxy-D-galactose acyltransferase